jgi:TM2 domain-containing membrane protein YozV
MGMSTIRWITILALLCNSILLAGSLPATLHSEAEVRQHLFGDRGLSPLEVSPALNDLMDDSSPQKKSPTLAAIYSLLVPGMGELYAGGFGLGKYFLIAESGLWLTYAAFDIYGNSLRDDARAFAVQHAGINPAGKNDQYFIDIGNFLTTQAFNDQRLRDREFSRVYDVNAGYAWNWGDDASRAAYRDQRISSENMYNNKKFVVTAIIINHVASAINAARSAISHNKDVDNAMGELRVNAEVIGGWLHPQGVMLTVSKGF